MTCYIAQGWNDTLKRGHLLTQVEMYTTLHGTQYKLAAGCYREVTSQHRLKCTLCVAGSDQLAQVEMYMWQSQVENEPL